jgi:hypothetical protein
MTAILLVETAEGDTVGVRFPDMDAARDWEDKHPFDVQGVGCVRLVTRTQALQESRRD